MDRTTLRPRSSRILSCCVMVYKVMLLGQVPLWPPAARIFQSKVFDYVEGPLCQRRLDWPVAKISSGSGPHAWWKPTL